MQSEIKSDDDKLDERRARRAAKAVHYPIIMVGENRRALVVGGGAVADRKIRALVDGGIQVTVLSPTLTPNLRSLWAKKRITVIEGRFPTEAPDMAGFDLVLSASDDRDTNAAVGIAAKAAGVLVNIADDPESSDFYTPAVARDNRLGVTLAISTHGKDPKLARAWRKRIAEFLSETTEQEVITYSDQVDSNDSSGQT